MKISKHLNILLPLATVIAIAGFSFAKNEDEPSPSKKIKALMVTGEGYHDYEAQKKIISEGVGERLDIDWTIRHHKNPEECKTDLSKDGWSDAYDIVVYDEKENKPRSVPAGSNYINAISLDLSLGVHF